MELSQLDNVFQSQMRNYPKPSLQCWPCYKIAVKFAISVRVISICIKYWWKLLNYMHLIIVELLAIACCCGSNFTN